MKHVIFFAVVLCMALKMQGQNLVIFKNNKSQYGFKDKTGKVIVEPKYYSKPTDFKEGRAIYTRANLKGVLDENGREIVPAIYKDISDFEYGFALATKAVTETSAAGKPLTYELKGFIDRSGKETVPVQYRRINGDFSNGWFVQVFNDVKDKMYYNTSGEIFTVKEGITLLNYRLDGKSYLAIHNGKTGVINQQYKELLPFEYGNIRPTENGMLIVRKDNFEGVMDSKYKWIIKPTFKRIHLFEKGYAVYESDDGQLGAINAKGVITTKPQFEKIFRISKTNSALAMFKNKGSDKSGIVDLASGKIIVPANYYFTPFDYNDGMIEFKRDNKRGMMDSAGKEIFYDTYKDFSPGFLENLAWVVIEGKYGFIDKAGKLVIPALYETAGGFNEGLAKVKLNGKYGFVNAIGETVIPFIFKNADSFEMGLAWVVDESGKIFYIDNTGKEVK